MHLIPILLTVFIDALGFGLVFPIFSPMIVSNEVGIFPPDSSLALRGLVFGLLVSAYCVGQFFGGPLLGSLSDRLGRKKVLVSSMWLAFIGYLFAGLGVILGNMTILFFARLMAGVSAGNFPVAQSVIADVSTPETKAKNFGLVGMSCWTGFVIGPFLGGRLAAHGFTVPFASAALICLFSALLLLFVMRETLQKRNPDRKITLFKGFSQIRRAFTMPAYRGIFISMFIFCLGWGTFTEFSPVFLTRRLEFNVGQIANFYAWVGLWIAICQGFAIRPLLKRFSPEKLLAAGLLGLGITLPIMLKLHTMTALFWYIPFVALCQAFIFPTSATLVSNLSSSEEQGEMLGINNSVQWAAIAVPPLLSGSIVALYPHLPITIGSACMLIAFGVFLVISRKSAVADTEENKS